MACAKSITVGELLVSRVFAVVAVVLVVCYLAAANYRLPFLTMDELRAVSIPLADSIGLIKLYGRPSQLIAALINEVIGFYYIDWLSLTPRFFAMMALFFSFTGFLYRLGLPLPTSVLTACFAVATHQLDWQHNGLIAFFGGYPLMLALFLGGLLLAERKNQTTLYFLLSYLLILASFASEFFVGLAVVCLIAGFIERRQIRYPLASPLLWAFLTYGLFFFLFKYGYQEEVHSGYMTNYLIGGLVDYSGYQILHGAIIYLTNSIPLYNIGPVLSIRLGAAVSILFAVLAIVVLISLFLQAKRKAEYSPGAILNGRGQFSHFAVIVCLIFVPPILMAVQPMKLNWALTGASVRYSFSLYTWLGMVSLFAVVFFRTPLKSRIVNAAFVIVIVAYLSYAIVNNLRFIESYSASTNKWREFHERLAKADHVVVDLPIYLFRHRDIVSLDKALVEQLVAYRYSKKVRICRDELDLTDPLLATLDEQKSKGCLICDSVRREGKLGLVGFHGQEEAGRWTSGGEARLYLPMDLAPGDVIEINVTNVFRDNATVPTRFVIGDNVVSVLVDRPRSVQIPIATAVINPEVLIIPPFPQSPRDFGIGVDSRVIGIMIKSVRILRQDSNMVLQNVSKGCF